MPRKRKSKLRPKLPSRVKKTRTKRSARARNQHPELWGLGAIALGLYLGAVLYFGWSGGYVGGWLGEGLDKLIGDAKYVVPVALGVLGALVVTRSALVDVRPFRTGMAVLCGGLMITLGKDQGGYLGQLLGGAVGVAIGATGSLLLGVLLMLVGSLLLSGASLGAILRRSGRGIHTAARRARSRSRNGARHRDESVTKPPAMRPAPSLAPPVDAVSAFPDVVGESVVPPHAGAQPAPLQTEPPALLEDPPTLFDEVTSEHAEYKLPDAGVLRISPEHGDDSGETAARVAELLVQTLAHFGVEATVIGQISGPRVTRYELQLAPGTKVAKVAALKDDLSYALATTEIRILAPIPGQAGGRRRAPEPLPEPRHARRHLRADSGDGEPGLGLARQGHLRRRRLDRPRAHAAPAHRGHDRLGQVGLPQHGPHVRPPARDARRRAPDPHRPEADRAQPLRVGAAPAHAGRLEPEGGERRPRQLPRRDGAPLRAPRDRARAQPQRGESRLPPARRADAPVRPRRDRRARRPDDGRAAGGGGCRDPARPEVARRRDPPRPRHAAAVGRRDHRDDQGERPVAHRLRRLVADRLARDPRLGRRGVAARPGRHALQAARHLAAAARAGRVRVRGGDRARRRADAPARAGARRELPRAPGGLRRAGRRRPTASSTRTTTRSWTRRSRSSSRPRRPPSPCCSGACASATRAPAG